MTTDQIPDLKPCPFCGWDDPSVAIDNSGWGEPTARVICPSCDCEGPVSTDHANAAIEWNERHETNR